MNILCLLGTGRTSVDPGLEMFSATCIVFGSLYVLCIVFDRREFTPLRLRILV